MLRTSSIRHSLIITLLFSISSMPVLGQTSNHELISGLFNFGSDGSVSPGLIKESGELAIELVGNAHQHDNAVNSYKDAYRYYNYGAYELALRCIDKSIEAWNQTGYLQGLASAMGDVNPSDSWNLKGLILNKLGRYEEAINSFDFALDINPENYYAWANKGDLLYGHGSYEEAIKCYDSAIAINPSYTHAYIQKNSALSILQISATSPPQKNMYYGAGSIPAYNTPRGVFVVEGGVGHGGSSIA